MLAGLPSCGGGGEAHPRGELLRYAGRELGALENPLSQQDIDALMRSLLPVNGDDLFQSKDSAVRAYDFRRPTKFSKDLLRTLVMVHDNYARLLQSFFLASLRTRTQVLVRSTNQYLYAEYTQLLPNPMVVATFNLAPLPGTCLLEMSQNIAYAIVDRVFGGPGSETQPQRGLSEIELSVIQRTIQDIFTPLAEAWRSVSEVKPTLVSMETNPMFLQTSPPSEVLAVITLGVGIGEHMGHITLAFPFSTMDPVLSRLSPHRWLASDREPDETELQSLRSSIQEAPVHVRVQLGHARISVGEFMDLKIGDVIPLDSLVGGDLPIYVGNTLAFYGRPGLARDQLSVQIRRRAPRQAP